MQAQNLNASHETTYQSNKESKLASLNAAIKARTPKSVKNEANCNKTKTTKYFDFVGVAG